jgi:hypothetical protein
MSKQPENAMMFKRSVWLGVLVGLLTQMALKIILPMLVFMGLNVLSVATGSDAIYEPEARSTLEPAWLIQQAAIFGGSILAGVLAALVSPPRAVAVPVALALLSLLATFFEQLPMPLSGPHIALWSIAPCLGVLLGVLAMRLHWRRAG